MQTSRVGLSSPQIAVQHSGWPSLFRRHQSEEPTIQEVHEERYTSPSISSSPGKTGSILDNVSGLPSPPGTNSDIALPVQPGDESLMNESPPPTLISSPRGSRPVSLRSTSLSSSMSANSLSDSRTRTIRPSNRGIIGKGGGMSRSNSSSSSLAPSSLRPKGSPGMASNRRLSADLSRHDSLGSSPASRRESGMRSSPNSNGSRHHHSPSLPITDPVKRETSPYKSPLSSSSLVDDPRDEFSPNPLPRRRPSPAVVTPDIDRRTSTNFALPTASSTSRRQTSPQANGRPSSTHSTSYQHRQQSPSHSSIASPKDSAIPSPDYSPPKRIISPIRPKSHRVTSGAEEDRRIREAEEKVRDSISRRNRRSAYPSTSPTKPELHRHDSYTRSRGSSVAQQVDEDGDTLRRSRTLGDAASLARTPSGEYDDGSQDRSGGSGGSRQRKPLPASFRNGNNNLFTPSPKSTTQDSPAFPYDYTSPTASYSRFGTTSRLARAQSIPSPSSPRHYRSRIDGLERSSSVSSRMEKRWSESVSGLPRRYGDGLDHRAVSHLREDLLDRRQFDRSSETSFASKRHSRGQDYDLAPSLSRLHITPGDSVSAVGTREPQTHTPNSNKDPLEVLRRMEVSRAEHNRQWDAERSASVLGDHALHRPSSRANLHASPQRVRPATSMSSLRDGYYPPRTTPAGRDRRTYDDSSPLQRVASRMSYAGPSSEPRQMRSYTSLGGRSSASLDINTASSEHGRLLYEAARALEVKIPQEMVAAHPDILRIFNSSARSAETNNAAGRALLQYVDQVVIEAESDTDPARLVHELKNIAGRVREACRSSDQNVRDYTRVLLDLPKLLREGSRQAPPSSTLGSMRSYDRLDGELRGSRRMSGSLYDSPVRRSEELVRPTTSLEGMYPSDRRRTRESLPPNFAMGGESRGFMSRLRDIGRSRDKLASIEDSPPNEIKDRIPDTSQSPLRQVLKKKASQTSTHTVRAGNNFLPSASKAPLTAVSTVTAGDGSPTAIAFDQRSVRSTMSNKKSNMDHLEHGEEGEGASSPRSRFSFHTAEGGSVTSIASGVSESRDEEQDSILSGLVEAQKRREEGKEGKRKDNTLGGLMRSGTGRSNHEGVDPALGRKYSVSDRFKKALGGS